MAIPRKPRATLREVTPTSATAPQQLSLVPAESEHPAALATSATSLTPTRQLWLCVFLPRLPLEAVLDGQSPAAVFEEIKGIRRILLANTKAQAVGVGPGLSVNAALALLPTLQLEARNLTREAEVLKTLAELTEKFTAFVSVEAPSLLLLEIAGSVKLFGGIKILRERIVDEFVQQGFCIDVAIAPTPLAATWLARAGRKVCIRDARNLVGKLSPLSITCLCWPEAICNALKGMGITSIGEARRLPREGFAKRFGAHRLLEFDRATGVMPDPRVSYRAVERFSADYDLNAEESDSALLLNICQELLTRLEQFLLSRQMAVQHIELVFFHLQEPATHLHLGCVQADRAVRHWFDLLEIKFANVLLPAPVIAIQLCGGPGQLFLSKTEILPFNKEEQQPHSRSMTHLAERLSARMGEAAVHGVMTVPEHRPQHAWRRQNTFADVPHYVSDDVRYDQRLSLRRPLWLLQSPERLAVEQGVPCYQGALRLLEGPERLETGWWDDDGITRDYFVACNTRGARLWVFRDRGSGSDKSTGAWYLHGKFG